MANLTIILRRARSLLWTAFSIIVVLTAVLVGIGELLMPYSARYQPQLESWLSAEFGQPVVLESFDGEWAAFGPRLTLQGMRLLPQDSSLPGAEPEVAIESAALDIKPLNFLLPGSPLYNFRVIGASLELVRTQDGEYRLSGFGVSRSGDAGERSALGDLARVGEVVLQDSSLDYVDERYDIRLGVRDISGRITLEGDELAAEISAQMFDRRSELAYGNVEGVLLLELDEEQKMRSARWQGRSSQLMLAALQGKLPHNPFLPLTGWLDTELWGEWSRQEGHRVKGRTSLRDALLSNDYQDLHLEQVDYRFQWRFRSLKDWNLHLADFYFDDGVDSWTTPQLSMARNTANNLGLWISADRLPLGVPLKLTRDVMSVYGKTWPSSLPDRMNGFVSDLNLMLSADWRLRMAVGDVQDASMQDASRELILSGLDGVVALDDNGGQIALRSDRLRVDWPRMFQDTLELTVPGCQLDLHWATSWQAGLRDCRVANNDIDVAGDLLLAGNEGKPSVDANFVVLRGAIDRLDAYWPQGIMPENTVAWLRRGLIGGTIDHGRFQIFGDMDDWPFSDGRGRFEALARVSGGVIEYHPGWPIAHNVSAEARFVGAGMEVTGSAGDLAGVAVDEVRVSIENMGKAKLDIAYRSDADLPGLLSFLEQSPLAEMTNVDLTEFRFAGSAPTTGSIFIPLGKAPGELSVNGSVLLQDASFQDSKRDILIEGISGMLNYSEQGFSASGLPARFRGRPVEIDLGADGSSDEKFRADLSGRFGVRELMPGYLWDNFGILQNVSGESDWDVSLVVAPPPGETENEVRLSIGSLLQGVAIDLPAPLAKESEASWPFRLDYPLGDDAGPLDVVFEDRAALRFDLQSPDNSLRSFHAQMDGQLEKLPPPGFIRLSGAPRLFDLDGWVDVIVEEIGRGSGMGGLALEAGRLNTDRLLFMDRPFEQVAIDFSLEGSVFSAAFDARDIQGTLRYTSNENGTDSLAAEFERLRLGDPVTTGVSMETDPADLPDLHLYARSLAYGGLELGETRIEAYPTAGGFRFEKVDARSESLSVQANGHWSLTESGPRSEFSIHMVSESLGDFLQSMDISSSVQGGQTVVNFDAWWQGTPAAFGLSRLNGQVDFSVVQGNISNASAGPGRLLGLVSVQALPRRLSLDFRDVFDSGFSFDEATGSFSMENGIAETNDVLLKSSAASISVKGRTDLVERRYDQVMTIRPGLGNTLPIIGALAAGPGGAAAGLALQGLLHEQLSEATQVRYSITGPWDEPIIEPVEVERVEETE